MKRSSFQAEQKLLLAPLAHKKDVAKSLSTLQVSILIAPEISGSQILIFHGFKKLTYQVKKKVAFVGCFLIKKV